MFERVDRDRTLARLRVVVAGTPLALGVRAIARLAEARPRDGVRGEMPAVVDLGELEVHRLRVVDGHGPADDDGAAPGLLAHGLFELARELVHVRRHEVAHAHPHVVADAARGHVDHPERRLLPLELRERAERLRELIAAAPRVQERGVNGIHAVVLHLEPVAREREPRGGLEPIPREIERVVDREAGSPIGRPHVREDHAAEIEGRIRPLAEGVFQSAARRLPRCFEDPAVDVEDPAVVAAANPPLTDQAVLERRAAVRAVQLEQPDATAPVAEQHEILPEDPEAQRNVRQLPREGDRLPEAAEILAARRAGADPRELLVGRRDLARVIRAVRRVEDLRRFRHRPLDRIARIVQHAGGLFGHEPRAQQPARLRLQPQPARVV